MDPITRKEMFLARAGGQDVETPEPITREETFLQEIVDAVESGGGASGGDRPLPVGSAGKYVGYNSSGTGIAITPDATPTNGSNKLVTSDGVYDALAAKQDKLTFDSEPTENSPNSLTSGAVYAALDNLPSGGGEGLSSAAKEALLALLEKVAYIDENGADYYETLEDALYGTTTTGITAVFNQGQAEIFTTDSLESLRQYLTVTATKSDGKSKTVSTYTLSGTLTKGVATITVDYQGLTDTFNVNVTLDTSPVIATAGSVIVYKSSTYQYEATTNGGVTKLYDIGSDTTLGNIAGIVPTQGTVFVNDGADLMAYDETGVESDLVQGKTTHVNMNTGDGGNTSSGYNRWAQYQGGTMTEFNGTWTIKTRKVRVSVDTRYLDRAYMYDKLTGKVIFAGRNTPYWGMDNISEESEPSVLQSISAVYNGGNVAMGSDVNALKTDLVVTATYADSSTKTVPSTDYTLSGNLSTVGSKTITVSYQNKTTTFNVTVTEMRLEAVFSGTDVLTSTPLNDLKTDLVVTLYEGSTSEVIPSADYSLSGTLTKGTSVVEVSYRGVTTTFTINNVTLDTTAKIAGSGILSWSSGAPKVTTMTNGCYTTMCDAGESSQINYVAGIVPTQGTVLVNNGANMVFYQNDATESDVTTKAYDHVNMNTLSGGNASSGYNRWAQYQGGTMTEWTGTWPDAYQKLRLCLDSRYLDRAYLIDKNTGKVFFAGRNTPYWGMENISEASA